MPRTPVLDPPDPIPFVYPPYAHQLQGFNESKDALEYALFAEMGTGKSKILIDNICYLWTRDQIDTALIVAPKSVYLNWHEVELDKHMWEMVEWTSAAWFAAPNSAQKAALVEHAKPMYYEGRKILRIVCMNVDGISQSKRQSSKAYNYANAFLRSGRCFMVVDESTFIKNPRAKRTKAVIQLGGAARYRRIASGEPMTRDPMDLYSQIRFLGPNLLPQRSFFAFKARYAQVEKVYVSTHTFDKVVGFQNLDELKTRMQNFSFRVRKRDCLDLPEKIYLERRHEMDDEQRKQYRAMAENSWLQLNEAEIVTAPMVMTQLMKLHQIVCGFITLEGNQPVQISESRLQILDELVEGVGNGKAIIWAPYTWPLEQIVQRLRREYGELSTGHLYGATPAMDRQVFVERFQDPADPMQFIVGYPRTGGFGVTLTAAETVIYYSNNYDWEARAQSEDRAHRVGQTKNVTYVDIVTKGTIDEGIKANLTTKQALADQVMNLGWRRTWETLLDGEPLALESGPTDRT